MRRKGEQHKVQIHIENGPLLHIKFEGDMPAAELDHVLEIWKKRHMSVEIVKPLGAKTPIVLDPDLVYRQN
jgi:hypothetical protein